MKSNYKSIPSAFPPLRCFVKGFATNTYGFVTILLIKRLYVPYFAK